MNSFESEIHGIDEEVGVYEAKVSCLDNSGEGKPGTIFMNVDAFQQKGPQELPQGSVELTYHISDKEFIPLNEPKGKIAELYPSIIMMLEEALGGSWGTKKTSWEH